MGWIGKGAHRGIDQGLLVGFRDNQRTLKISRNNNGQFSVGEVRINGVFFPQQKFSSKIEGGGAKGSTA